MYSTSTSKYQYRVLVLVLVQYQYQYSTHLLYVRMHVLPSTHVRTYVHTYVRIYARVFIHTYSHIQVRTSTSTSTSTKYQYYQYVLIRTPVRTYEYIPRRNVQWCVRMCVPRVRAYVCMYRWYGTYVRTYVRMYVLHLCACVRTYRCVRAHVRTCILVRSCILVHTSDDKRGVHMHAYERSARTSMRSARKQVRFTAYVTQVRSLVSAYVRTYVLVRTYIPVHTVRTVLYRAVRTVRTVRTYTRRSSMYCTRGRTYGRKQVRARIHTRGTSVRTYARAYYLRTHVLVRT